MARETSPAPPELSLEQALAAPLLPAGRLFLDRQALRHHLSSLCDPQGARVLVVDGPPGSGKSSTVPLIRHVARHAEFEVALVDLEAEAFHAIGPSEVAERLASQMGLAAGIPPATQYDSDARQVLRLSQWLVNEVGKSGRVWWFVFDGFDNIDVRPDSQDFIHRLAIDADARIAGLRVVVLGWSHEAPPLKPGLRVLRVTLQPFVLSDVHDVFEHLVRSGVLPLDPAGIQQVVDAVAQAAATDDRPAALATATQRVLDLLLPEDGR
jgi:hypothetical protein